MSIRVASFNVENLFARYRFREGLEPGADTGFGINDLAFDLYDENLKRVTAKAVKEVDADVICLQEVESIAVLERFNSAFLASLKYKNRILVDSHDPRFIDVAVLSRYPFTHINTHRDERNEKNTGWLFSRDCLEVDIDAGGKALSLYVNHFKSMMEGRDKTRDRRLEQTQRVAEIVDGRWKESNYEGNFIVCGDFNDYEDAPTSLSPLLEHPALVNVTGRLPENERWTHFYAGGHEYRQLDYLLLSQSLASKNPGKPAIMRKGMPWRAEDYAGERFEEVGENDPKASDHAPLYMDIELN
jgi:endonuclease/exonuclease/phosphatase family metal-dependent hydrolase